MKLTNEKILDMGYMHSLQWESGSDLIAFARAILKEAGVEEMERDAERLEWLGGTGAHLSWSRDGEMCNVWLPAEGEEDARPAEGYPQKCYGTVREAIDGAMKAK